MGFRANQLFSVKNSECSKDQSFKLMRHTLKKIAAILGSISVMEKLQILLFFGYNSKVLMDLAILYIFEVEGAIS